MKNLSVDELRIMEHSLEFHLGSLKTFKRGNYGRLIEEEEMKINSKIASVKEILTKLD